MLSTAQAHKHWEAVLKCLAEIKARAATHLEQLDVPFQVKAQLKVSAAFLARELTTPVASWKQLLKQQVRDINAPSCCMHTQSHLSRSDLQWLRPSAVQQSTTC
jgi:hypothetical protein